MSAETEQSAVPSSERGAESRKEGPNWKAVRIMEEKQEEALLLEKKEFTETAGPRRTVLLERTYIESERIPC